MDKARAGLFPDHKHKKPMAGPYSQKRRETVLLFDKLKREKRHTYEVPKRDPGLDQPLSPTLEDTLARLAQLTGQTADLQVNRLEVEGYKLAFVMFEGLVNYQTLILGTASDLHRLLAGQKIPSCLVPDRLCQELFMAGDKKKLRSFEELIQFIASGFAVLLIDGSPEGCTGVQGFSFRSIGSRPRKTTSGAPGRALRSRSASICP